MNMKKSVAKKTMNKVTYEIDIAQEFKDVKSALTGL